MANRGIGYGGGTEVEIEQFGAVRFLRAFSAHCRLSRPSPPEVDALLPPIAIICPNSGIASLPFLRVGFSGEYPLAQALVPMTAP